MSPSPSPQPPRDRSGILHGEQQPDDHRGHRSTISPGERAYFAAVAVLAGWVGFPAYFAPAHVDSVLPFAVPPMHAQLIGGIYLAGLAFTGGGLLARRWAQVRVVPVLVAIWTGGLLLVTLLHLEDFDFAKPQTQIWFGAYLAYPVIGIWILARRRGDDTAGEPGSPPPTWTRRSLTGQGAVLAAFGVALLLAPEAMAAGWPWPVTPLLAQIYSAPLLAFGVSSLLLARARRWSERRIGVLGIGLFGLAGLIASVMHRAQFATDDPAAWLWFGALAALTTVAVLLASVPRRK